MKEDNDRSKIAQARLLELAQRPGGVGTAEISGMNVEYAGNVLRILAKKGKVFIGKVGSRTVRYFGADADARAWERGSRKAGKATMASGTAPDPMGAKRSRAWWPADAEPVITSATKVTIYSPPERQLRTNTHSE